MFLDSAYTLKFSRLFFKIASCPVAKIAIPPMTGSITAAENDVKATSKSFNLNISNYKINVLTYCYKKID